MQISSRAVMFWGCRWATWTFNSLQRFSMGLRSGDWLGPLQDLEMLLTKPLLRCPGRCVWDHCHAERPSHVSSSMPLLMEGGFHSKSHDTWPHSFFPLHRSVRPGPFAEKQPQSMMFPPPMLHSRYGVLWMQLSILSPPNTFLPKSYILVSSDHMTFSQSSSGSSKCSLANFRRAWTCTGLSRGTRLALQDLSPWRRSVLLMVAFVTLVPALCRSLTRSPRVVLGFLLTVLVIILTPRVRSCVEPRSREIINGLVCLPFLNNCSHSWFLHTKLLTYCRFSLPSLVQVYNFVSGVLWQLFGLGHSGVWSVTVWGWGQGSFILITSFKQMPLIQVTSGGQRSLLKKKLQVCESQQSCLFVGDQILIFHHNLQIIL